MLYRAEQVYEVYYGSSEQVMKRRMKGALRKGSGGAEMVKDFAAGTFRATTRKLRGLYLLVFFAWFRIMPIRQAIRNL